MYIDRTICYVHHNISKSSIVCVNADDFSERTFVGAPDFFPDVSGEFDSSSISICSHMSVLEPGN